MGMVTDAIFQRIDYYTFITALIGGIVQLVRAIVENPLFKMLAGDEK